MSRHLHVLGALVLLAGGLLLGCGDAFLTYWEAAAGGGSDIRARGPWLLALYVPYFAALTAVVTAGAACWAGRRRDIAIGWRLLLALVATAIVGALLYLEPTAAAWRVLGPVRRALGAAGAGVLDVLLVAAGLWLLARHRAGPRASGAVAG